MSSPDRIILDFFDAASSGHLEFVRAFYRGSPADYLIWEISPLHCAAANGHVEVCRWLLKQGFCVDQRDFHRFTPLINAARNGHTEVVRLLAGFGGNVHARHYEGTTPLIIAAGGGHTETCRTLIALGADPNEPDNRGATPLMWTALRNHLDTFRLLRTAGASLDQCDIFGMTAFHLAAWEGHSGIVREVLDAGTYPDQPVVHTEYSGQHYGLTPLYYAARALELHCVAILLVRGADPRIQPDWQNLLEASVGREPATEYTQTQIDFLRKEILYRCHAQAEILEAEERAARKARLFDLIDFLPDPDPKPLLRM